MCPDCVPKQLINKKTKRTMKLDPYNHKENYLKWKENIKDKIPNVSKENSEITLSYLNDMERGVNISAGSVKGSRSYIRLNNLKLRLIFFSRKFKKIYGLDNILKINEEQLISFFSDMRNGTIKKANGKNYIGTADYIKVFKAFWHWHMKTSRKKGVTIEDITVDIDTSRDKPKWVYLTEEQIKNLCNSSRYDYRVLFTFLFDTGIRAPTEVLNIKVSDLLNDCKEVHVREEISKTFGRRIKLMLTSELLKEYIKNMKLETNDYLFSFGPETVNKYLKRVSLKLFGKGTSEAGGKYSELSLYDFRHCSCCYWLPRYKSESALKYRFGWKKSDKIHYYSELLGMKDTISEEDMLVDITKTEIEKRLEKSEKEKEILQDRLSSMEEQMQKILEMMKLAGKKMEMVEN
jgi:integrase